MNLDLKDLFTEKSVEAALKLLFKHLKHTRLGDTIKEVERVAYLSFIGAYDKSIRRTNKTDHAKSVLEAIKIVRLCAAGIERMGCLYYGQNVATFLTEENKPALPTLLTHVCVASVTEYEKGYGDRPDGFVLAIKAEDHKALLKSDNGQHLCGNSHTFSTVNSFYIRELTDKGREVMRKAISEGKRAIWIHSINELIHPVT